MIVFNENNADNMVKQGNWFGLYLKSENIFTEEDIRFENSFICLQDVETQSDLVCNHNLIVLGNLKAKKITIKERLICFGDIKAKEIEVGNYSYVFGEIICDKVNVGGVFIATNLELNNMLTGGKDVFLLNSGIIEGEMAINGSLFCGEGLIGEGGISANNIIAKDYCDIWIEKGKLFILGEVWEELETKDNPREKQEDTSFLNLEGEEDFFVWDDFKDSNSFSLFEIKREKTKEIIQGIEKSLETIEENLEFEEISKRLHALSLVEPFFKDHHKIFQRILFLSSNYTTKTTISVEEFLELLNLKKNIPGSLLNISIVNDILGDFLKKQKGKIKEFPVNQRDKNNLIKNLSELEANKDLLSKEEYRFLYQKLFLLLKAYQIGQ